LSLAILWDNKTLRYQGFFAGAVTQIISGSGLPAMAMAPLFLRSSKTANLDRLGGAAEVFLLLQYPNRCFHGKVSA